MVENVIQIKSWIKISSWCECKNLRKHHVCKKDNIWNPATCSYKIGKYLASIIDDSMIACNEIKVKTKTISTNFNEKKITCKCTLLYFTHLFTITIPLLIAVSIYCYLIKYQPKHKHLLPYQTTNNKIKKVLY